MPTDDPTPEANPTATEAGSDAPPPSGEEGAEAPPIADASAASPPELEPGAEPAVAPWFEQAIGAASGWAKDAPAGDEAQYAEMAKALTPEAIGKLDPSAQAIVRALLLAREKDAEARQAAFNTRAKTFDDREAKAAAAEARARQQVQSLAKLANSEAMKALLERAKSTAPTETATEEGRQALLQREVAKNLSEVFKPVNEEAAMMAREANWNAFLDRWPRYKDNEQYERLTALLNERDAEGRRIDADSAAEILAARDERARIEAEALERRRVQAASAVHVNRSRGTTGTGPVGIPDDVKAAGRTYEYLQEHPDVLAALRQNAGLS